MGIAPSVLENEPLEYLNHLLTLVMEEQPEED